MDGIRRARLGERAAPSLAAVQRSQRPSVQANIVPETGRISAQRMC